MYSERERLSREFEEKHSDFLAKLKMMPKSTEEQKERRWKYFREYPLYNDFVMELLEAYRPGACKKICLRLSDPGRVNSEDVDIASRRRKKNKSEIDPAVFMESVKKAISGYTGENQKGISFGFTASVGIIYRQEADRAGAENDLKNSGVSDSEIPRKNMPDIFHIVRQARDLRERNSGTLSGEEAIGQILKEGKYSCAKRDLELVQRLIFGESISVSLDQAVAEGETALGEFLADEKDDYREILEGDGGICFLEIFFQKILSGWKNHKSTKDKKEQDSVKMFFTRDILKILKLDKSGRPYMREPAGNEDIYFSLKPYGKVLYEELFYVRYLCRAFVRKPENFYETYVRLLRKDFDFSDRILADLTGKNKSTISRRRKMYLSVMEEVYDRYRATEL